MADENRFDDVVELRARIAALEVAVKTLIFASRITPETVEVMRAQAIRAIEETKDLPGGDDFLEAYRMAAEALFDPKLYATPLDDDSAGA